VADPDCGVFDTMLARDGVVVDAPAHLGRLSSSVRRLYGVHLDLAELADRVDATVAGTTGWQRVRVTYEPRKDGGRAGVATQPLPERLRAPWTLEVHTVAGGLGEHKWIDRSVIDAWRDPAEPDTDALLVDEGSLLLETGRGNVFVVHDGVVATPPLDGRILPGVVRARVLAALGRLGIRRLERGVTLAELAAADEVFVTNAVGGVRPVAACRDVGTWPHGPVTHAVDDEVEAGRADT
jgi:para-aminobenzoate synthetase / 4-amino-4-deoxychorismate lyase